MDSIHASQHKDEEKGLSAVVPMDTGDDRDDDDTHTTHGNAQSSEKTKGAEHLTRHVSDSADASGQRISSEDDAEHRIDSSEGTGNQNSPMLEDLRRALVTRLGVREDHAAHWLSNSYAPEFVADHTEDTICERYVQYMIIHSCPPHDANIVTVMRFLAEDFGLQDAFMIFVRHHLESGEFCDATHAVQKLLAWFNHAQLSPDAQRRIDNAMSAERPPGSGQLVVDGKPIKYFADPNNTQELVDVVSTMAREALCLDRYKVLYHGTDVTSAINILSNGIVTGRCSANGDFNVDPKGFYVTDNWHYAWKRACTRTRRDNSIRPAIVVFVVRPKWEDDVEGDHYRVPEGEEWRLTVARCRLHRDKSLCDALYPPPSSKARWSGLISRNSMVSGDVCGASSAVVKECFMGRLDDLRRFEFPPGQVAKQWCLSSDDRAVEPFVAATLTSFMYLGRNDLN